MAEASQNWSAHTHTHQKMVHLLSLYKPCVTVDPFALLTPYEWNIYERKLTSNCSSNELSRSICGDLGAVGLLLHMVPGTQTRTLG